MYVYIYIYIYIYIKETWYFFECEGDWVTEDVENTCALSWRREEMMLHVHECCSQIVSRTAAVLLVMFVFR